MSGKQRIARWMKYHGGGTVVLAFFILVACLGGFDLSPALLLLSFIISAVFLVIVETIFWKIVIWIMGKRFVAGILNDPWLIKK